MDAQVKFERYQLIDVAVIFPTGGSSLNIQDQPMLRFMRITRLETYTVNDFPISPITGNRVMNLTEMQNTFLQVYTGDPQNEKDTGEFVFQIPFTSLHYTQNSANDPFTRPPLRFDDLLVQWEKTELIFAQIPSTISQSTYSTLIGVYYTSRASRVTMMLHKKLSGIGDGSFADMLATKMMQFEDFMRDIKDKMKQ
jgi:hypothetical protein